MAGDLDTRFLVYSDVQGWMPRMDPLATVGWNMRQPEIDELRAEVENYSARISDLRAENDSWQEAMLDLTERFRQSQVEIARLRAFVQKVALYSNDAWLAREADELAPGASL